MNHVPHQAHEDQRHLRQTLVDRAETHVPIKDLDSDEQFAAIPNQRTRFTGVREDDRPLIGLGPSL